MWTLIGWSIVIGFICIVYESFQKAAAEVDARHAAAANKNKAAATKTRRTVPGNDRRLQFNYVDVNLIWSKRSVKLQRVEERHGLIYLRAFCELRDEERTFRTDRIQGDIVDLATGEIVTAHSLLK